MLHRARDTAPRDVATRRRRGKWTQPRARQRTTARSVARAARDGGAHAPWGAHSEGTGERRGGGGLGACAVALHPLEEVLGFTYGPCRAGYRAGWDTVEGGIPCRVGYHAAQGGRAGGQAGKQGWVDMDTDALPRLLSVDDAALGAPSDGATSCCAPCTRAAE